MRSSEARRVLVLGRYDAATIEDEFDALSIDDVPTLERGDGIGTVPVSASSDRGAFTTVPTSSGAGAVSTVSTSAAAAVSLDAWRAVQRGLTRGIETEVAPAWNWATLAGRVVELCGGRASAVLTSAFGLVLDAQRQGEPVVWITLQHTHFFPPDVAANGVDLDSLVVVRVKEPEQVPRAADQLARSGAFGLLVLDLGPEPRVPAPLLSRLLGLAQKHESAVVCLSAKPPDSPSLDSLVSLRADVFRARRGPGVFDCVLRVAKDKRHAPGWRHVDSCRGPAGVR
jgi:recombination protein RecA